MTVEWRHNKRILFISSGDNWTWDDARTFQNQLQEMLQSVPHPVQIVIHFRPEFRLPPGGFTDYIRRMIQMYQQHNVRRAYYVAGSPDILVLMQSAIERNGGDVERHIMHNNLDEILQRAIAESGE